MRSKEGLGGVAKLNGLGLSKALNLSLLLSPLGFELTVLVETNNFFINYGRNIHKGHEKYNNHEDVAQIDLDWNKYKVSEEIANVEAERNASFIEDFNSILKPCSIRFLFYEEPKVKKSSYLLNQQLNHNVLVQEDNSQSKREPPQKEERS